MRERVYFPNLNGLRFIAAFMVILHHYELNKLITNDTFYGRFVIQIGTLGVILFFTLSGFLITYLLLQEKEKIGKVQVKKFYKRRILRIWPLYFLIVFGSLYVFNNVKYLRVPGISFYAMNNDFFLSNILYIFMMPNIAFSFGLRVPYAYQTWSIGVEEQFYLFWPLLFNKFANTFKFLIYTTVIYFIIKMTFIILNHFYFDSISFSHLTQVISISSFDSMTFGGLAALIAFKNKSIIKTLFNKYVQVIITITLSAFLIFGVNFSYVQNEVYSLLFAFLILNMACNKNIFFSLENKVLDYLGKVSYGLYMYHFLAIRFIDLLYMKIPELNHWLGFAIVLITTIILSVFSYEFFEKYFIKKKKKYSNVISGDNVLVPVLRN